MGCFEVAGLVLGAILLLTLVPEQFLTAFEVEGPQPSARRQNPLDKYGRIITCLLLFTYPNALDDMERIEKNVLGADDQNAIIFKISFSSSLSIIAVAVSLSITHSPNWVLKSQQGAIIAPAAMIGLLLNEISSAHWTAEAFFKASSIAGAFSAFFSDAVHQEINGLHGSEDIRDWLSRPMTQAKARLLNGWLKSTQSLMYSPKSQLPITTEQVARYAALHDRLAELNSRNCPKRASLYSTILLTAPAYLLGLALTAFTMGLGIYLGAHFTQTLRTDGSRDIFIFCTIITVLILAIFYLPTTMKQLGSVPMERFTRLMNEIPSMVQVHPSSPNEHDTHSVDGAVQTRPTETHNENVLLSLHGSRRQHARLPNNQAHAAAMDSKLEETSMPLSEAQVDSATEVQRSSTSVLEPSALTPAGLQDVPHSHPSADQAPPMNGFRTALKRFIRAQEESIEASKALLRYETDLRPTEHQRNQPPNTRRASI